MSDSTSCVAYWRRVFEFTERMHHAAKEEDWESLATIEKDRREVLYTLIPPLPDDVTERTAIRHVIREVIDIDQRIIPLCQDGQRILAEKIQSLRIGERARRAYGL